MEVYFNTVSQEKCGTPMKELWVDRKFSWNGEAGFIPAIYVGAAGIIVRLCLQVSPERIRTFREKWGDPDEDDDWTEERLEQAERELPFGRHFEMELEADGEKLCRSQCTGDAWDPLRAPDEAAAVKRPGEYSAEQLADYYGCDKSSGWYFEKAAFRWKNEEGPMQEKGRECSRELPTHFKLTLHAKSQPRTGTHFVTEKGCGEHTIGIENPVTGEQYQLTIHECSSEMLDENLFQLPGREKLLHPRCCLRLFWSIDPEIPSEIFSIRDCAHSDQPQKKEIVKTPEGEKEEIISVGYCAVHVLAAKQKGEQRHMEHSALHHEPVDRVEWRTVFQVKEDVEDLVLEWDRE